MAIVAPQIYRRTPCRTILINSGVNILDEKRRDNPAQFAFIYNLQKRTPVTPIRVVRWRFAPSRA